MLVLLLPISLQSLVTYEYVFTTHSTTIQHTCLQVIRRLAKVRDEKIYDPCPKEAGNLMGT